MTLALKLFDNHTLFYYPYLKVAYPLSKLPPSFLDDGAALFHLFESSSVEPASDDLLDQHTFVSERLVTRYF